MFSKALFKQTCKANWIKWVAVTVATCAMLAIVIIVLGNLGINDIRDSLKNIFVQANQEAELKSNAVDGYNLYNTTVEANQQLNLLDLGLNMAIMQFNIALTEAGQAGADTNDPAVRSQVINQVVNGMAQDETISSILTQMGIDEATFIAMFTQFLTTYSNTTLAGEQITASDIIDAWYLDNVESQAYNQYLLDGKSEEEALASALSARAIAKDALAWASDTNNESLATDAKSYHAQAQDYITNMMKENAKGMAGDYGYETEDEIQQFAISIKVIANTAISTYQLVYDEYSESGLDYTQEEIEKLAIAQATSSISDQMPANVQLALNELGNMDIYGLIIGSIFYRIAGLLLPMVFVIMVANGLLAGQVDSGSMAYVLSTPTKRRTVTVTQMTYLILSLLAMFLLLTCVSVVSVFVVGGNNFAINYAEILLFNLGAFLTMFAIAGYCFMCSSLFNRTKYSMSIGGGLTIFCLVCTILGLFGSSVVPSAMRIGAMDFFNYLSIITFFDTVSIMNGTLAYLWKFAILLGIGIVTFIIGVFRFDKKDLPL